MALVRKRGEQRRQRQETVRGSGSQPRSDRLQFQQRIGTETQTPGAKMGTTHELTRYNRGQVEAL